MDVRSFFHVALKTRDIDDAVGFYRDHLGAEDWTGSRAGGRRRTTPTRSVADERVYLFARAPYEAAGLVDDLPPGSLHFGYVVDDVDAAMADLGDVPVVWRRRRSATCGSPSSRRRGASASS